MAAAAVPIPPMPAQAPAPRSAAMIGGAVGAALLLYGVGRRGLAARVAGLAGAGVLAATFGPIVADVVASWSAGRDVDVALTYDVPRPREDVFRFFRNFENFPLLLGVLDGVVDFDDGRSRWRVKGRDGSVVEWGVLVTKYVPPRVLGWESLPGAAVESWGTIRFTALDPGTTRLTIEVHHAPRSPEAVSAFRAPVTRRPTRHLRAALARVDAAMTHSLAAQAAIREPSYPLPGADPVT